MTKTIDEKAYDLLGLDDETRAYIAHGTYITIPATKVMSALTEALTRVEELEGALKPFASEEILHFVDKSPRNVVGLSLFRNAACVSLPTTMGSIRHAHATLSKGITE